MIRILLFGICSVIAGVATYFGLYWYHEHAFLKHMIKDGYLTAEDLIIVLFITGIVLGFMSR